MEIRVRVGIDSKHGGFDGINECPDEKGTYVAFPFPPFPESAMVNGRGVMITGLLNNQGIFASARILRDISAAARWISPAPFRSANPIRSWA